MTMNIMKGTSKGTQAVAGLRRDDDTSAAAGDDVPELL
jgi:hypothetical protein